MNKRKQIHSFNIVFNVSIRKFVIYFTEYKVSFFLAIYLNERPHFGINTLYRLKL